MARGPVPIAMENRYLDQAPCSPPEDVKFAMAIKHLLAAALLFTPASALAQTAPAPAAAPATESQAYRFAGTEWGASSEATSAALKTHGFTLEQTEDDGSLIFAGAVNDRPALVVALFLENRLSKILISVPTSEETTLPVYREMRGVLDGQYGAPEVEVESYAYPFAEGKHVGYEATAIRVGKARIGAMWQAKGEALGLRISERLIVSAHYESPAWKQDLDRRAQRSKTGL
jgi:hypothetical protein